MVTPFDENFEIDLEAYGRLVDVHLERGTAAIVPCGCTGEAATLSHEEQIRLIRFVVERVAGRIPIIAGTGSNSTAETIALTRQAKEVGATAVMLITPYYNKPTPAGQIAHYTAVAEAVDIPIVLYNVPSRTGTNMLPDTVAQLSRVPGIVAIKEAAGKVDQVSEILKLCSITVLSGDDGLALPMMVVGATGVVSVAANIVPEKLAAMCSEFDAGRLASAREIHRELTPLFKALFIETNPMPVKAALARMGLIKNFLRLPLTPALPETEKKLFAVMAELGL